MRAVTIGGLLLMALGAFILLRGLTFGSQRSVMRVGDFQASVEESQAVPPWVGGIAIVGGLVLIGSGMRRRRAT